jgi:hypothetical protein
LLEPRQSQRYATAREIRDDLERFKAGKRTMAEMHGWPARSYDDEATRKTSPVVSGVSRTDAVTDGDADAEKTRRTVPPPAPPIPPLAAAVGRAPSSPAAGGATTAPGVAAAASSSSKMAAPREPLSRRYRIFRAALLLIVLGLTVNEISIGSDAGRLAAAVATYDFDRLPTAWQEYDGLFNRSRLHFGTAALEHSLIRRTSVLADRVIANYRTPSPTVREAQWTAARDALNRALSYGGDDSGLRASLRYCEGHLHRINGEAQKTRGDADAGQEELTDAVVAFREAAELRSGWADPFLGLSRTFVIGLEDVERGADALNQAQQLGYMLTDRDALLLADGYRARGASLVRSARQLKGLPQEREYLTRAADAYRLALTQYANAPSTGTVPQNIARTQRALVELEQGLGEGVTALPEGTP